MQFKDKLIGMSGIGIVLVIWATISATGIYNPIIIPNPINVFISLIEETYLIDLLATFTRVITAFTISAIIGVMIGLIVGYYKILDKATEPLIDFIRSIPGIALFPLFILMFGVSEVSRSLVAIFIAVPIILINTKYGVKYSNKLRKNMNKIYKISKLKMLYKVILPEASPHIFSGVRVAISLIIILVIVTEMMIGTQHGIGQLIVTSQYQFETAIMYAMIILLGTIGYILNLIFSTIEKTIFHWRN